MSYTAPEIFDVYTPVRFWVYYNLRFYNFAEPDFSVISVKLTEQAFSRTITQGIIIIFFIFP